MIYDKKNSRDLANFLSMKVKEVNELKKEANGLEINSDRFSDLVRKLNIIRTDIYNHFAKFLSGSELESLRSVNFSSYESSTKGFMEKSFGLEEKLKVFLSEFNVSESGDIPIKNIIINYYKSLNILKKVLVFFISFITLFIIPVFASDISFIIKKLLNK